MSFKKFWEKLGRLLSEPYILLAKCLPLQDKVVFCNYFGRGMADDPKFIALELLRRKAPVKLVWMLSDMSEPLPEGITPVRYASVQAKWHLYTAKVWVYNYKNAYKVSHKRPGQYYIQCWHGSFSPKSVEKDTEATLDPIYVRDSKRDSAMIDLMYSNNDFTVEKFKTAFWYNGPVIKCDSPQLAVLVNTPPDLRSRICAMFGINPADKIVIYAPTFRNAGDVKLFFWDYEKLLPVLEERFGGHFVFLLRLHPNMAHLWNGLDYSSRVIPASNYPDMDELMAASDVMISDFSGVMYDMGIAGKPVFLYAEDCDEYIENERHQYMTLDELPFTMARSFDELVDHIRTFDADRYKSSMDAFLARIGLTETGHGPERLADIIQRRIAGEEPVG